MPTLTPQWQRLSKRQQLVALVAGGLAVVWGVHTITLRPLSRWVSQLHREVRDTEARLIEAVAAGQQAEAVDGAFAAYEPYVAPSGPPETELAGFLGEVESALQRAGLAVLNLKPVPVRDSSPQAISVTVESESTPGQLVQFLDLLQRSKRLLRITELAVRASEGRTLRSSMVISKLLLK